LTQRKLNSNGFGNGLKFVKKAHCYRTLVVDGTPGRCSIEGNQCRYCYDQRYSRVREMHQSELGRQLDLGLVVRQLQDTNKKVGKWARKYEGVRIGALGDIMEDEHDLYITLLSILGANKVRPTLVTKSSHTIDWYILNELKEAGGVLQPSMGFYTPEVAQLFERVGRIPPSGRRKMIEEALKMDIPVVLRLNPMHPDYMWDHLRVLQWFASVGGKRVILEVMRIMSRWATDMPGVDFSSFVPYGDGPNDGWYRQYRSPSRNTTWKMLEVMLKAAELEGIEAITICGWMEANDKVGYRAKEIDCCQLCDIWGTERPPRSWD